MKSKVFKNKIYSYWNVLGVLGIFMGLIGFYLFIIKGWKPSFLYLNVPTFYSRYIESKTFTLIKNNQIDELSVLSYGIGLIMLFIGQGLKNKKTMIIIILYVFAYSFLHGLAIIYFTFIFLFVIPLLYIK